MTDKVLATKKDVIRELRKTRAMMQAKLKRRQASIHRLTDDVYQLTGSIFQIEARIRRLQMPEPPMPDPGERVTVRVPVTPIHLLIRTSNDFTS